MGLGWVRAVPLTGARCVLFHLPSQTWWLTTDDPSGGSRLLCFPVARGLWLEVATLRAKVSRLGDTDSYVVAELPGGGLQVVDPFSRQLSDASILPADVVWRGNGRQDLNELPAYQPSDPQWWFDRAEGTLTDRQGRRFTPAFAWFDPQEQIRYIGYPGLGVAVADERTLILDVYQLGPVGADVKALAHDADSLIWVGGNGEAINVWRRSSGAWRHFSPDYDFGLSSGVVRDIAVGAGWVCFATELGIACVPSGGGRWRTLREPEGLVYPSFQTLGLVGTYLMAGGNYGLNILNVPSGPVWRSSDVRLDKMRCADIAVHGDTAWVVGVEGVFQGMPFGSWKFVSSRGEAIGDEPTRAVTVDRDFVYLASRSGIRQYDRTAGVWTCHLASVFLGGATPLCLAAGDTLLWVGTDKGLFRFNRLRGGWFRFGKDEMLPAERIQALALEADTLWVGTPAGLTRLLWNRPGRDSY